MRIGVSPWDETVWRGIDGLMHRSKRARALSLTIEPNAYGSLSTLDCTSLSLSLSLSSCFSLHSSILSPRAQSFFLPSRPSRTEPLPAPYYSLRRSHFAPLFPLPSRLLICQAALRSHIELRIDNPSTFQSTTPCASTSLARRNARSD